MPPRSMPSYAGQPTHRLVARCVTGTRPTLLPPSNAPDVDDAAFDAPQPDRSEGAWLSLLASGLVL